MGKIFSCKFKWSSEFDIDKLEEELEYYQECLDYWLEEERAGRLNPVDEEER